MEFNGYCSIVWLYCQNHCKILIFIDICKKKVNVIGCVTKALCKRKDITLRVENDVLMLGLDKLFYQNLLAAYNVNSRFGNLLQLAAAQVIYFFASCSLFFNLLNACC